MEVAKETNYYIHGSQAVFESMIETCNPIYASDAHYLNKIKKSSVYEKNVKEFIYMKDDDREDFIEALTDLFSFGPQQPDIENWSNFKNKLKTMEKFGEKIERTLRAYDNKFQPHQQLAMQKNAMIKINSNLRTIFLLIKDDIKNNLNDENLDFNILSRQVIFTCIKLGKDVENRLLNNKKINNMVTNKIFLILLLIIRLEAARRGKIKLDSLHEDLTLANSTVKTELLDENLVGSLFEVLNISRES